MEVAVAIVTLHGLVSAVGGVIGYVKAKSLASLAAGGLAGAMFLLSAYGMAGGHRSAAVLAAVVAVALGVRFLVSWPRTRRVFPDLIMLVLSAMTLCSIAAGVLAG